MYVGFGMINFNLSVTRQDMSRLSLLVNQNKLREIYFNKTKFVSFRIKKFFNVAYFSMWRLMCTQYVINYNFTDVAVRIKHFGRTV